MRFEHTVEEEMQTCGAANGSRVSLTAVTPGDDCEWPIHIEGDPKHIKKLLLDWLDVLEALTK